MSTDLMTMFTSLQGSLLAHRPHLTSAPSVASSNVGVDGPAVPVSLLTGFLGAGKSTLLASLLTNPPEAFVVKAVVNDVGQLPFDPTLIAAGGELEVELTNGCGCCADSGDVGDTLATLARGGPDLLVLEASGIADPFALAQIIEADPGLRLDRIVAVVDGRNINSQSWDPLLATTLRRQLEAAHVVVLSHADQLSTGQLERATADLASIVPGRAIVSSTGHDPTAEVLLPGSIRGAALPADSQMSEHLLVSVTAKQVSPMTADEISTALALLPPSIVRCKGVLRTPSGSVLVQATPSGCEVTATLAAPASALERWSGLTIVGTDDAAVQTAAIALGCAAAPDHQHTAVSPPGSDRSET